MKCDASTLGDCVQLRCSLIGGDLEARAEVWQSQIRVKKIKKFKQFGAFPVILAKREYTRCGLATCNCLIEVSLEVSVIVQVIVQSNE